MGCIRRVRRQPKPAPRPHGILDIPMGLIYLGSALIDEYHSSGRRNVMEEISGSQVREAFVAAIRAALHQGNDAFVPGLGVFRVAYRKSSAKVLPDGGVELAPPKKELVFLAQEAAE